MDERDKTASDGAFLCTGITTARASLPCILFCPVRARACFYFCFYLTILLYFVELTDPPFMTCCIPSFFEKPFACYPTCPLFFFFFFRAY